MKNTTPSGTPAIEIRGGSLAFGTRTLWDDLDLSIAQGEYFAVLGPNGSGKSTITQCLVQKQRGQIFGDSADISELAEDLEFPTPSAAAVFVLGGSQNGWTEWVNNDGETLNQVYRSED